MLEDLGQDDAAREVYEQATKSTDPELAELAALTLKAFSEQSSASETVDAAKSLKGQSL